MPIDVKITAVEKAYDAISARKKTIAMLEDAIKGVELYKEPDAEGVLQTAATIPVQWPDRELNGPQKHIRVTRNAWKAYLQTILDAEYTAINAIDVDGIIAAEKAKG